MPGAHETARPGRHRYPRGEAPFGGPEGNKWWTLTGVCFGTFMLLLDVTIVNVALPDIQSSLGSSFADLQWVIDAAAQWRGQRRHAGLAAADGGITV